MISENRKNVTSLDVESKIRLLLTMINDDGHVKLKSSLDKLTSRLKDKLEDYKEVISKNLFKQILFLPLKTSIYSTIASVLFTKDKQFVTDILNTFIRQIQLKNNETSKYYD